MGKGEGDGRLARVTTMGEDDGTPKTPQWQESETGVPAHIVRALARQWARKKTYLAAGAAGNAAENMELKTAQLNAARVRLTEKVRGQIQARPLTTIGVAVASGIVLSWLLKSRK